jgi:scyllo-inositol 2-dehydrogenase (NADP+)
VHDDDQTRLVVIGYGMGALHARFIDEVEGLTLRGVCDAQENQRERASNDFDNIQVYSDFQAVLDDPAVDGVVIVTPHNLHAPMAIAAMNRGKHAVTDKAMCLTVEEARAMIEARDRNGVLLSTFQNRRWDREFLTVRKTLCEGLIGRLFHIESCVTSWGEMGGWRADRTKMGGWLYDWGAHTIDQILLLSSSPPKHVYAFRHHRSNDPSAVEDYINCTITFQNGLTATTVIGYLNRIEMPRWYVIGNMGSLRAENFDDPIQVKTAIGGEVEELSIPLVDANWREFYDNLADTFAGRAELAVKPEQLVPQIAIAEAAYKSIEVEQVVPLALAA